MAPDCESFRLRIASAEIDRDPYMDTHSTLDRPKRNCHTCPCGYTVAGFTLKMFPSRGVVGVSFKKPSTP